MSKYYTPSAEEFHIGFRYEANEDPRQEGWVKYTVETYNDIKYCIDENSDGEYRVKYLDKSDIEELGWRLIKENHPYTFAYVDVFEIRIDPCGGEPNCTAMQDNLYYLFWQNDKNGMRITITNENSGENDKKLFAGKTKNYNELKKLMTQIGII